MSNAYKQAQVYVRDVLAGVLSETDFGYSFRYDPTYLNEASPLAVSITMPLTQQEYSSSTLFPFFDGLIPEGWLLDVAVRNWKLDRNDRFGLLLVSCKDCIGDVTIREADYVV